MTWPQAMSTQAPALPEAQVLLIHQLVEGGVGQESSIHGVRDGGMGKRAGMGCGWPGMGGAKGSRCIGLGSWDMGVLAWPASGSLCDLRQVVPLSGPQSFIEKKGWRR